MCKLRGVYCEYFRRKRLGDISASTIMTGDMETFTTLLDLCEGNDRVTNVSPKRNHKCGALMYFYVLMNKLWTNIRFAGDMTLIWRHCNFFPGFVYDAVLQWAYGVNRTLEAGGAVDDGLAIADSIFNMSFHGITGMVGDGISNPIISELILSVQSDLFPSLTVHTGANIFI